jgi:predicted TIM-barrel fold metal-dependent hydrolase
MGAAVREVLEAEIQAGGGRFKGIRHVTQHDDDPTLMGVGHTKADVLMQPAFREGFAQLAPLGLCFDAYLYEPQIDQLTDLARAFPQTQIVLDHTGTPLGLGRYAGSHKDRFPLWQASIRELATCQNVVMKLGGLGMPVCGFASFLAKPGYSSEALAAEWGPYFQACIEAFGAERCMFESNFPTESGTCSYATLWNVFKRAASGASADEKTALFSGTARRFYGLDV